MNRQNAIALVFLLVIHLISVNKGLFSFHVLGCQKVEREALSKLKHSFDNTTGLLSSWKGQDCCQWEGVRCDNITGHVVSLDLRSDFDSYSDRCYGLNAQKLEPSLVELRHLRYLDLSCNNFQMSPIPEFIGSLNHLSYLNLSLANFSGVVPPQLGNLTRLQVLDLSWLFGYMTATNLHWVSGLSSLQHLDMSGIDFNSTNCSVEALNRLPSLSELLLGDCVLGKTRLSHLFSNTSIRLFSTLHHLDLSGNYLDGPLPYFFANLSSLRSLDLSGTGLNGSIPLWLRNLGPLDSLVLSANYFSQVEGGTIMGILTKNSCNLKVLDLSSSLLGLLQGDILGPYENVSQLKCSLESLDLSYNNIIGFFPDWLGDLRNLMYLSLRNNGLFGQLPTSIGNLSSLQELSLDNNNFSASIPSSIGSLSSLKTLDLSENNLQGAVSNSHLANLSRLEELNLYGNSLKWELSSNWTPPFQLTSLDLGSCVIGGQLPPWIQTQRRLISLSLPNTGISGNLPEWFWSMNLADMNLSDNHITGPITYFPSSLEVIDLSHNFLSGPLPRDTSSTSNNSVQTSPCHLRSLFFMDLSNNNLSGTIPDCLINSNSPDVIRLSFNKLSGLIPNSIGLKSQLNDLQLSNNLLEGPIPIGLNNLTGLQILDLGENKLSGKIPSWGNDSHQDLQILRLRGNQFGGAIPENLCTLPHLHILDLANNNLTGNIPRCFSHLSGMSSSSSDYPRGLSIDGHTTEYSAIEYLKGEALEYTTILGMLKNLDLSCNGLVGTIPEELTNLTGLQGVNLSHNHLIGNIPKNIGKMMSLESLDLSNNNLSGTIPSSISTLTTLSHLNLSCNQLHGEIPTGNQLQTLNDPSIYSHNPGLCGDPLPKCIRDHDQQKQQPDEEDDKGVREDNREKVFFYIVVMLGLATGFWGVVGAFLLNKRGRYALFRLVDDVVNYFYVQITVRIRKLRN